MRFRSAASTEGAGSTSGRIPRYFGSPPRGLVLLAGGSLLLLACVFLATTVGSVRVPLDDVVAVLGAELFGGTAARRGADAIIWQIRLPRVLMAALVGAGLSVSGAVYQSLLRNPLADPYLLGVSSGAGLFATVASVLGATARWGQALPAAAFAGALVASVVIVLLARVDGRLPVANLVLAGVALGSMLSSMTAFLLIRGQSAFESFQLMGWLMGSLAGAGWPSLRLVAPYVLIPLALTGPLARWMNLLMLGEEHAASLGVPLELAKALLLAIAGLLAAASVAGAGLVGFVGLIVPHAVRLTCGPDNRLLVPVAGLAGACFVILCDTLTRVLFAPLEVPVGIMTALFGAPFFLWLLRQRKAMTLA